MGIENESNITVIQSWLKTQPHLPQNIGKIYLLVFLCKSSYLISWSN